MNQVKCDFCDSIFSTTGDKQEHISKVHKNIRKHKCSWCEKAFHTSQGLNIHMKTVHEQSKEFRCEICKKDFGLKNSLFVHNKRVHDKLKEMECKQCLRCFFTLRDLVYDRIPNIRPNIRSLSAEIIRPNIRPTWPNTEYLKDDKNLRFLGHFSLFFGTK